MALVLTVVSMLLPMGCSKDPSASPEPGVTIGGDIAFEIGFIQQTRVTTDAEFKSFWEDGDQIGIYAVRHAPGMTASLQAADNYIHNVKLTYNKNTDQWSCDDGVELWFPTANDVLDFYAYYPYDVLATDPTAIPFSVNGNQNAQTGDKSNYDLSELLAAQTSDVARTTTSVSLDFLHALAMVQVKLPSPGKGFGPSEELMVYLRGVKTAAMLNLGGDSGLRAEPVADGQTTNITMYRLEQPGDTNYETSYTYRALVPTQTLAAGSKIFVFERGDVLFGDIPLTEAITLVAAEAKSFIRTLPDTVL